MRLRQMMTLCVVPFLLSACAATTGGVGKTECAVFRPVSWSVKDTDRTVTEVRAHNARRKAWCE
jgi:hypothetical protein